MSTWHIEGVLGETLGSAGAGMAPGMVHVVYILYFITVGLYLLTVDLYLLPEVRQSLVDSRYSLRKIVLR